MISDQILQIAKRNYSRLKFKKNNSCSFQMYILIYNQRCLKDSDDKKSNLIKEILLFITILDEPVNKVVAWMNHTLSFGYLLYFLAVTLPNFNR